MAVALVGPTASGKSALALDVARAGRPDGRAPGSGQIELVSVDSMAVYRGMDLGTDKPTAAVRAEVPYHLLDLVEPSEEFTVHDFQAAARRAMADIAGRGGHALLVGGTGLYLRSVVDDLSLPGRYPGTAAGLTAALDAAGPTGSPERLAACRALHEQLGGLDGLAAARIEPANERRIVRALEVTVGSGRAFSSFGPGLGRYPPSTVAQIGIRRPPDEVDRRIAERFTSLMDEGLLDEVRALCARPDGLSRTARQALGYRELLAHLERGVPIDDAVDEAIRRTRVLARRQWAWFRRDPRIVWVDPDDDPVGTVLLRVGERSGKIPVGD